MKSFNTVEVDKKQQQQMVNIIETNSYSLWKQFRDM